MSRQSRSSRYDMRAPRVVGDRPYYADYLDARPARTWVWQRRWWPVPSDVPYYCPACGDQLSAGINVHRTVIDGEAVYRHPACSRS